MIKKAARVSGFSVNGLVSFGPFPFSFDFASTTNAFCFFTFFLFRWLFEVPPEFHFAKETFALHFLFQCLERLFYIVFADNNLNYFTSLLYVFARCLFQIIQLFLPPVFLRQRLLQSLLRLQPVSLNRYCKNWPNEPILPGCAPP